MTAEPSNHEDDREEDIAKLIDDYNEAVEDENDAASRVDTAAQDLENLGVDVTTDPRTAGPRA